MKRTVKVLIEKLDSKGRGIGRFNNKKIIVDYVIPGDLVEVEIYVVRKGRGGKYKEYHGKVIDILSEGEGRVKPKCSYFGLCGGCRFQNWEYKYQLKFKHNVVYEAMNKWNINGEISDVISSPRIWYYRNRMDYAISYDGKVGLKELGNWSKILDLKECYLMSQESVKIMDITREFMIKYNIPGWDLIKHEGFLRYVVVREGKYTGERMVNYITWNKFFKYIDNLVNRLKDNNLITSFVWGINPTVTDVSVGKDLRFIWGKDHITEKINNFIFHIHPNAFFQTNSYQTMTLVNIVKSLASGGNKLLDLYCGVGLFSVFLAELYNEVIGIEVEDHAIYSGNISLKWNDISNIKYICGKVEDFLHLYKDVDTVIVDPPRPGMSNKVIKKLIQLSPKEIIYVSCNPDSMMRDISMLREKYVIDNIVYPIDMFPHTSHIEVITRLAIK